MNNKRKWENAFMLHVYGLLAPFGTYHKLSLKKYRWQKVLHEINSNTYIINLPHNKNISSTYNFIHTFDYYVEEEDLGWVFFKEGTLI